MSSRDYGLLADGNMIACFERDVPGVIQTAKL